MPHFFQFDIKEHRTCVLFVNNTLSIYHIFDQMCITLNNIDIFVFNLSLLCKNILMFGNTYMYNSYKLFRSWTIHFYKWQLYDGAVSHFVQDKLLQRPTRTKIEKLICTRTFVQVWNKPRNKVRQIYCTTVHLDKTILKNSVVHAPQEETARCLIFNNLIVLGVYVVSFDNIKIIQCWYFFD